MKEKFVSTGRLSHCVADGLFLRTRQNLAYTPSQMMKLTERGIPVSSQNMPEGSFLMVKLILLGQFLLNVIVVSMLLMFGRRNRNLVLS